MGKKSRKQLDEWQEAKRRCGLSDEDVRMAKELGFRPRSLLKNLPSKSQPWKAPVREWIRDLYAKRFGRAPRAKSGSGALQTDAPQARPAADERNHEELLPQYDTQSGEIFYTRASDDAVFTMEEAGDFLQSANDAEVPPDSTERVDPTNVRTFAEQTQDANLGLRQYLKQQDHLSDEQVDQLVREITDRVWASIDCTTCANCCKELQIGLTDAEAQRLAGHLGLTTEAFCQQFLEAIEDQGDPPEEGEADIRWHVRGKPCAFLKDDRCMVYDDRPRQCCKYPYLHEPDFSSRTLAMVERTFTCPIVYRVFEELRAELSFTWRRRGRR
jgi:uncharacterized protein